MSTTQLPKNWKDFLRVNENKRALFKFLAQQVTCLSTDDGKVIYATEETNVLSTMTDADITSLAPVHTKKQTHVFFYMQEILCAKGIENCASAQ